MREFPPWIAAYLAHALGPAASGFEPFGTLRCPRHYADGMPREGSCERPGYVFRQVQPDSAGESFAVVWDGKTPYSDTAVTVLGMDPDLPYGLDLSVRQRHLTGYFCCGWCGKPEKRAPTAKRRAAPVASPTPSAAPVDEARRDEIARWAEKLEAVNPAMAAKVRSLVDLPPPRR